jgi:uncharacterized caspase-like protein
VRDLRVFRNQSLVSSVRGDLTVVAATRRFEIPVAITLAAGANEISAYAFNRDDVKSEDEIINVAGPAQERPGIAYVIAVGINEYSNSEFNLKYAAPDADLVANALPASLRDSPEYSSTIAVSLTNRLATKHNVLAALGQLAGSTDPPPAGTEIARLQRALPQDAVIIYFAGHGGAAADRYYLLVHDVGFQGARDAMQAADWNAVYQRSISDHELDLALEKVDAGRIMLIIDACQSGKVLEAEDSRRGPLNSRGLAQLAYEKGAYVLAATQSNNAALELARLGHGVLTYSLFEQGIMRFAADGNGDGQLTVQEWFRYASNRVPVEIASAASDRSAAGRPFAVGGVPLSAQRPRAYFRRGTVDDWLIAKRKP